MILKIIAMEGKSLEQVLFPASIKNLAVKMTDASAFQRARGLSNMLETDITTISIAAN